MTCVIRFLDDFFLFGEGGGYNYVFRIEVNNFIAMLSQQEAFDLILFTKYIPFILIYLIVLGGGPFEQGLLL